VARPDRSLPNAVLALIVTSASSCSREPSIRPQTLLVVDTSTGATQTPFKELTSVRQTAWSHDGKRLAIIEMPGTAPRRIVQEGTDCASLAEATVAVLSVFLDEHTAVPSLPAPRSARANAPAPDFRAEAGVLFSSGIVAPLAAGATVGVAWRPVRWGSVGVSGEAWPARDQPLKDGTVTIDESGSTNIPGIFAGGDVAVGASTVIKAVASGERAAVAIDRYLRKDRNRQYPWRVRSRSPVAFDPNAAPVDHPAFNPKICGVEERRRSFVEVQESMTAEAAEREAKRCLRCDYGGAER